MRTVATPAVPYEEAPVVPHVEPSITPPPLSMPNQQAAARDPAIAPNLDDLAAVDRNPPASDIVASKSDPAAAAPDLAAIAIDSTSAPDLCDQLTEKISVVDDPRISEDSLDVGCDDLDDSLRVADNDLHVTGGDLDGDPATVPNLDDLATMRDPAASDLVAANSDSAVVPVFAAVASDSPSAPDLGDQLREKLSAVDSRVGEDYLGVSGDDLDDDPHVADKDLDVAGDSAMHNRDVADENANNNGDPAV